MSGHSLLNPKRLRVGRSELRDKLSCILGKAIDNSVVVVTSGGEGGEKCVLDGEYFEKLLSQIRAAAETLEITADPKMFQQILKVAQTIDEDIRLGKLHSFDEAFGDSEED